MVNIPAPDAFIVEQTTSAVEEPAATSPEAPKWMDSNFMTQLLREKLTVTSMNFEDAVAAGENYGSNVKQAKVETTLGSVSLFIKSLPQTEFRAKFMVEMEIFKREINMYSQTLPLIK
jgi:hypothetical protein